MPAQSIVGSRSRASTGRLRGTAVAARSFRGAAAGSTGSGRPSSARQKGVNTWYGLPSFVAT